MTNKASRLFPVTYQGSCYYRKKGESILGDGHWFATIVNFQIILLMMDKLSEDIASFPSKQLHYARLPNYAISQTTYASMISWYD